jgi:hypothetical protein
MSAQDQIVCFYFAFYLQKFVYNSSVNFSKLTIVLWKNVSIDVFIHLTIDIYLMMK